MYDINETGSATNSTDLLIKLRDFMVNSCGFTEIDNKSDGNGQRIHFSKNGKYYNFRSYINEAPFSNPSTYDNDEWSAASLINEGICSNISLGYDTNNEWDRQIGYNTFGAPILRTNGNIVEYDFFYNGKSIHIAAQVSSGVYEHMTFGELDSPMNKIQQIISATFHHNFDDPGFADSVENISDIHLYNGEVNEGQTLVNKNGYITTEAFGNFATNSANTEDIWGHHISRDIPFSKNPYIGNNKHTFLAGLIYLEYQNEIYYISGTCDGLYFTYFKNYSNKELVDVGGRRYVVFTFHQKTSPWDHTEPKSSGMGVALRVNDTYTG